MKILLVAAEAAPFAKTGGLADVAGSLPKALKALGHDVRIMLPAYPWITAGDFGFKPTGKTVRAEMGSETHLAEILEGKLGEVTVYLAKNDFYFDRPYIYGPPGAGDYPDSARRFSFLAAASLEALKNLAFQPEVIHCNDWHTAIIPGLLKTRYQADAFYKNMRTLYTIHNLGYQGIFPAEDLIDSGLEPWLLTEAGYLHEGKLNLMKGGICLADALSTVSANYAREIQTPAAGFGLNEMIKTRQKQLYGILNGIDYETWNPRTDAHLAQQFSINTLENKIKNKLALQRELQLCEDPGVPLLGLVSRLVEQKGIDILLSALPVFLQNQELQFIGLGTGEPRYEAQLQELAKTYPQQVRLELNYNEDLAHRIYAGADLLAVPSRYEPCGLSQLIGLRYGTIPVARATGGLADTVIDYTAARDKGNGFLLTESSPKALQAALRRALQVYAEKAAWQGLVKRAMSLDYSWKNSALEYLAIYYKLTVA